MNWEFKQPKVVKYEPHEFLGGSEDGEVVDVSGFNPPAWVITFEVRRSLTMFGRRLWTGSWRPMQMVAR